MTEKLKQKIKEGIEKLPEETQEAINSLDWVSITEAMGKKNSFTEEETSNLLVETWLVLIGDEESDSLAKNIEDEVETSNNEAEKIAEEVNQQIFTPINDILVKNIKNNLKDKSPDWEQTLDFILSGGNYAAFLERNEPENPSTDTEKTNAPDNLPIAPDTNSRFSI